MERGEYRREQVLRTFKVDARDWRGHESYAILFGKRKQKIVPFIVLTQ